VRLSYVRTYRTYFALRVHSPARIARSVTYGRLRNRVILGRSGAALSVAIRRTRVDVAGCSSGYAKLKFISVCLID
jgi:hypothetical protein